MPRLSRLDELGPSKAERQAFDCGNSELNAWLVQYASQAMANRDAVVYLLHEGRDVIGYFTLSTGSVSRHRIHVANRLGRRAPEPVPMVLLGRLGVDVRWRGRGFGKELVRQALSRALSSAQQIGCRGLFLHAIDDDARAFYEHLGFEASPVSRLLMMISFADLEATIGTVTADRE